MLFLKLYYGKRKMNILILTTLYQEPDDCSDAVTTPVVHNFAKEWVKQGHQVIVIHNYNIFLKIFYMVPKKVMNKITNRLGYRVSLDLLQRKDLTYKKDGVTVYKLTILKIIPQGAYQDKKLKNQLNKILNILENENFIPDIILAHAENPQIYQLYYLKQNFPKAITSIVFHGIEYLQRPTFKKWLEVYYPSIDCYGFRSRGIYQKAQNVIDFQGKYFLCPSGIADEYVNNQLAPKKNDIYHILFVGQLISRKHVDTIIHAISYFNDDHYNLTIIGEGNDKERLIELTKKKNFKNVEFKGKLAHSLVIDEMNKADCFIMVSEAEVFGLVYLEAMSQGCITVASTGEGIDGVIEDKKNGFLCRAGNIEDLIKVLQYIRNMTKEELKAMRESAFFTAKQYSESIVAEKYLKDVIKSTKQNLK